MTHRTTGTSGQERATPFAKRPIRPHALQRKFNRLPRVLKLQLERVACERDGRQLPCTVCSATREHSDEESHAGTVFLMNRDGWAASARCTVDDGLSVFRLRRGTERRRRARHSCRRRCGCGRSLGRLCARPRCRCADRPRPRRDTPPPLRLRPRDERPRRLDLGVDLFSGAPADEGPFRASS